MKCVVTAGVLLLAVVFHVQPVRGQITGTCCDKQVELSKSGAGMIRSRPGCFDCKEFMESGAKSFEEYVCKKIRERGPLGRVTFATECGVTVDCRAAGGEDVRESIKKQLRAEGVGCAVCPVLGASGTCPVQTELARLITETENRLKAVETAHTNAAVATGSCTRTAQVLWDVCVKVRTTPQEIEKDCTPVSVKCGDEQYRQNRLNWQRMVIQQDLKELKKLDFSCLESDGQCPELLLRTDYEASARVNEELCFRGSRAEFVYISNKRTGAAIGRLFVKCV